MNTLAFLSNIGGDPNHVPALSCKTKVGSASVMPRQACRQPGRRWARNFRSLSRPQPRQASSLTSAHMSLTRYQYTSPPCSPIVLSRSFPTLSFCFFSFSLPPFLLNFFQSIRPLLVRARRCSLPIILYVLPAQEADSLVASSIYVLYSGNIPKD